MIPFRIVSGPLLVASLVAALSGCSSKVDRIETSLRKSGEFAKLKEWDKVGVEVRNVLQIDPKNVRAYVLSAQMSEAKSNPEQAFAAYSKALELDANQSEAQLGLARLYLIGNQMAKAEPLIQSALASNPADARARTLAAALLLRRGQGEQGLAAVKAVVEGEKTPPVEASLLLAGIHFRQGKPTEALAVVERALQSDPKNANLLEVAAEITSSAPRTDPISGRAAGYFERLTSEASASAETWGRWAAFHAQRGEADKAEAVLRAAIQAAPKDSPRQVRLFNFVASSRGLAGAEAEIQKAIQAAPGDMALRFALVDTYRRFNKPVQAQKVLGEIVQLNATPESAQSARGQLAQYRLLAGQIAEARQLAEDVLKTSPRDNAALAIRARIHLLEGRPRDAIVDLRTAWRDQPSSLPLARMLVQAHRAAGEPQLGREVLADAVKNRPADTDLRLLLVSDLFASGDAKAAIAELDAAIKESPKLVRLYDEKARYQYKMKNPAGAERTLVELKAQLPKDPSGHLLTGQLYAQQKRFDAALKEFDAGSELAPARIESYASAVALLTEQKRFDEANARIDRRLKADDKNVLHHQLKGDVALAQRKLPAAEQAYRACIQLAPQSPVGYLNTARALAAKGDIEGLLGVLQQGEQAAPGESALPLARAEWLARAQRLEEAIALYETLLQQEPDSDRIANNLAYLLAETRSDKASSERALKIASRFATSRDPNQLDSLGWIHYRLGQYDQALPLLKRAAALAPPSPLLQLHLGKALIKTGDVAAGKDYLKKALDSKAPLPRLDEARAMLLAQG